MCAPEEEKLEEFYLALGAQTLRSIIQEDLRLGDLSPKQDSAAKLRSHVLERAKLFLHEVHRENIKHDGRWLEKNLWVKVVTTISLRRSLRGHSHSHTEKRSAALENERKTGWTLYVTTGNYDTYQISYAVCKLLLDKPNQSAYLTFEQFLNLSLYQLRSRGYNVERILRAKAAEQRIAEEERKKQMVVEQQRIKEQDEQWRQQSQVVPGTPGRDERVTSMPGAFGADSPENATRPNSKRGRANSGIFSSIRRQFGIKSSSSGSEAQEQLQNFLSGNDNGADSQSGKTGQPGPSRQPSDNPPPYEKTKSGTEKVSSPAAVQQNLHNAIQASRAYNSSTLFSPPTTKTIKEQASYCDSNHAQDITFLASASNGTRIFISTSLSTPSTEFLAENVTALNTFSLLLQDICDVYALPRKAMHVYYDQSGPTIAFNSGGAIFCNFRFYSQLHEKKVAAGNQEGKMEAGVYWWTVVAHELAHNLVQEHDSTHSFYTYVLLPFPFPPIPAFP